MSVQSVPGPAVVSVLLAETGAVLSEGWELAVISAKSTMFQCCKQIKPYSEDTEPPSLPALPANHVPGLQSTMSLQEIIAEPGAVLQAGLDTPPCSPALRLPWFYLLGNSSSTEGTFVLAQSGRT